MDRLPPELQQPILESLTDHNPISNGNVINLLNLSLTNHAHYAIATPCLNQVLKCSVLDRIIYPPWKIYTYTQGEEYSKMLFLRSYINDLRHVHRQFRPWTIRKLAPTQPYRFFVEHHPRDLLDAKTGSDRRCEIPGISPGRRLEDTQVVQLLGILKGMSEELIWLRYVGETNEVELLTSDIILRQMREDAENPRGW